AGYEPLSLEPVTIRSQKLTELGTLSMRRGTGSIEGRIDILPVDAQQPLRAELRGNGRRGCPTCAQKAAQQQAEERAREALMADEEKASLEITVSGFSFGGSVHVDALPSSNTCPACGYSPTVTVATFEAASGFVFRNLAAGRYSLQI